MLHWLWNLIQLLLPYGLIIRMYRNKRGIPANIRTRSGNNLRAIMITTSYGIILGANDYVANRSKQLMELHNQLQRQSKEVMQEINKLNFEVREQLFNREDE